MPALPPFFVGDSLAVGTSQFMHVRVDARVGRPLAEGMAHLPSAKSAPVLLVSLGTNNVPNVKGFVSAVKRSEKGRRCVVWATLRRPGFDYRAQNRALLRLRSKRLQIVGWATAALRTGMTGPDGIHPTARGYSYRALLYKRALRRCS